MTREMSQTQKATSPSEFQLSCPVLWNILGLRYNVWWAITQLCVRKTWFKFFNLTLPYTTVTWLYFGLFHLLIEANDFFLIHCDILSKVMTWLSHSCFCKLRLASSGGWSTPDKDGSKQWVPAFLTCLLRPVSNLKMFLICKAKAVGEKLLKPPITWNILWFRHLPILLTLT